ncbi:LacI family DNA-binding transcriptional regulator [Cerasicoccus frondis]|uniref:LacI family DNA-binding transcriptional regulator n=1 Tax=Cerasicoccus frondis TaxID=490090 RepID=UPI0028525323|nr:LacI family DNA-binding transcriptional regulator [Cerasicoccus frondis]
MRPSLRDVALKAGVNATTVSRALKNDPRVKKDTRDRILIIAQEMGYQRDARLDALNFYRNAKRQNKSKEVIAWLTNFDGPHDWQGIGTYATIFRSLSRIAEKSGYRVDPFWIEPKKMPPRRVSEILRNRGIRGVIIGVEKDNESRIQLDWEHFSAITLSPRSGAPYLNSIKRDFFHDIELCVRKMVERGLRRIILIYHKRFGEYVGNYANGSFLATTSKLLGQSGNIYCSHRTEYTQKLPIWLKESKADGVLTTAIHHYIDAVKSVHETERPFVASLDTQFETNSEIIPGILYEPDAYAQVIFNQIASQLNRFELGLPEHRLITSFPGRWVDESSTPNVTD